MQGSDKDQAQRIKVKAAAAVAAINKEAAPETKVFFCGRLLRVFGVFAVPTVRAAAG